MSAANGFKWAKLPKTEQGQALETRREELLAAIVNGVDEKMVEEWVALTKARDYAMKDQIEEKVTGPKEEKLLKIREALCNIEDTFFTRDETALKRVLMLANASVEEWHEAYSKQKAEELAAKPVPAPPPPPPMNLPPPPPVFKAQKASGTAGPNVVHGLPGSRTALSNVSNKNGARGHMKPKQNASFNLVDAIASRSKGGLKKTALQRSPGGTPAKQRRPDSSLLSTALRKKFQQAYDLSPEHPNMTLSESVNRSIGDLSPASPTRSPVSSWNESPASARSGEDITLKEHNHQVCGALDLSAVQ